MFLSTSLILLTLTSSFVHCAENDSNIECSSYDIGSAAVQAIENILGSSLFSCPEPDADVSDYVELISVIADREEPVSDKNKAELRNKTMIAVVAHGYLDSLKSQWMRILAKDLNKKMGASAATIMIDYSRIASCDYVTVVNLIESIGKYVASVLNSIELTGIISLIGHSLGAHLSHSISGYSNKKVSLIVGLDPAGPLYAEDNPNRLTNDSADIVEAYHTNSIGFGTVLDSGTVDFHINHDYFGQPFCSGLICAHIKAIDYFHAILNGMFHGNCLSKTGEKCKPGSWDPKCKGKYFCETVIGCYPYFDQNNSTDSNI